ncbi:Phosphatidylinositol 3; 4; 5-trisphosphate 5-phosphatase 1, partial [Camelus dromedarius]
MFENPLYGSVSSFPKLVPRKEQESPKMLRKEPPPCPDLGILSPSILLSKAPETEGSKGAGKPPPAPVPMPAPFLSPTPRLRSFTCSSSANEGRPAGGDKSQAKPKAPAGSQVPVPAKRPIKPSRSELSQQPPPAPGQRPPLPVKSPAVLHLQHSKGRDYRENAELPYHAKHRPEDAPLGRAAMQRVQEYAPVHACDSTTMPRSVLGCTWALVHAVKPPVSCQRDGSPEEQQEAAGTLSRDPLCVPPTKLPLQGFVTFRRGPSFCAVGRAHWLRNLAPSAESTAEDLSADARGTWESTAVRVLACRK